METLDRAKHSIALLCPLVYIPHIIADLSGSAGLLPFETRYLAGSFVNSSNTLSIHLVLSVVQLSYPVHSFPATQAIARESGVRYVQRRVGPSALPNGFSASRVVTIERHLRDVSAGAVHSAIMVPFLTLFVLPFLLDQVAGQGMSRGRFAAVIVEALTLLS